jgi:hypothetical protein
LATTADYQSSPIFPEAEGISPENLISTLGSFDLETGGFSLPRGQGEEKLFKRLPWKVPSPKDTSSGIVTHHPVYSH